MSMRAVWKDVVLAESDDTVVVEGNHYFPREPLTQEYSTESDHWSVSPWKGKASNLSVSVGGEVNPDAAWKYESPSISAQMVKDRVAFWRGVDTVSVDSSDSRSSSS